MKTLDLPPLWLALAAFGAWVSRSFWTAGTPWLQLMGTGLILLGLLLMAVAVFTMTLSRTTVIPHRKPTALVTGGIFALTRNPIYLGDVLVLAGLCLRWQAPLGLILVPVFGIWIARHFIHGEEARLHAAFGGAFAEYATRVRRWV